ncbi:MAG: ParB/RepB/Spo0J family partition protein [Alphaproteobacteria bacterium]
MTSTIPPKKKALGKGLSALFAENPMEGTGNVQTLPLSSIRQSALQPRTFFSETKLAELTESIKEKGVLQPIVVRPTGGHYEIVIGERRWRAAGRAELTEIPCIIRELSDHDALECAIIENLQRDDLSAIETAHAYKRLLDQADYTQGDVAKKLGISAVAVTNTLRLLNLPTRVQTLIDEGELTAGQARSLIGLPEAEMFADLIVREQLSARQVEEMVRLHKQGKTSPLLQALNNNVSVANAVLEEAKPQPVIVDAQVVQKLEKDLITALGLPVTLRPKGSGGRLTIRYTTVKDLEHLLKRLGM